MSGRWYKSVGELMVTLNQSVKDVGVYQTLKRLHLVRSHDLIHASGFES